MASDRFAAEDCGSPSWWHAPAPIHSSFCSPSEILSPPAPEGTNTMGEKWPVEEEQDLSMSLAWIFCRRENFVAPCELSSSAKREKKWLKWMYLFCFYPSVAMDFLGKAVYKSKLHCHHHCHSFPLHLPRTHHFSILPHLLWFSALSKAIQGYQQHFYGAPSWGLAIRLQVPFLQGQLLYAMYELTISPEGPHNYL